ncbi:MinD/ParA family protein [Gordonia oryzae]|uniref:MinD/ParA family protein n=2 Tax=Gordonia oryzae TaxID=2487349 RepID=A0A3N4GQ74_9ACTN|nr:MinD/ParA family protein [Gordonia oryzae]RPA61231.1 MinD/ParA family protein [Gordonia oryzae]
MTHENNGYPAAMMPETPPWLQFAPPEDATPPDNAPSEPAHGTEAPGEARAGFGADRQPIPSSPTESAAPGTPTDGAPTSASPPGPAPTDAAPEHPAPSHFSTPAAPPPPHQAPFPPANRYHQTPLYEAHQPPQHNQPAPGYPYAPNGFDPSVHGYAPGPMPTGPTPPGPVPSGPTPGAPTPPHMPPPHMPPTPAGYGPPPDNGYAQPMGFGSTSPQQGPALDEVALLRKARRAPARGWRRAVHTISAGTINPGDSASEIRYQQLLERLRRPVRGDYRIAVLSLKGGVGKTTTTVGLGSTFASLRGDRVIAVDANPDLGTLAQRVPQQTASTVRNLLSDDNVYRYSDVRAHTSQAPSRLEVLASERDPAMAEAFSEDEYRGVVTILQRFYNIIITDCGTGLSHSAMNGVLDLANAIILVSSPALDGARSASATLDWLEAHGYGHLVSRAVVVLSSSRPGSSTIDTDQLAQHFLTRCRAVQTIPFDDHLAEGADVDLELVGKPTRLAFVELAATIADEFTPAVHREEPFYD